MMKCDEIFTIILISKNSSLSVLLCIWSDMLYYFFSILESTIILATMIQTNFWLDKIGWISKKHSLLFAFLVGNSQIGKHFSPNIFFIIPGLEVSQVVAIIAEKIDLGKVFCFSVFSASLPRSTFKSLMILKPIECKNV